MFTHEEILVLSSIIISLETGGQVYGNGDWGCFGEAYQTSDAEHAISIGSCQWMGTEALKLLKAIYTKDPTTFKKLDTAGIYDDFKKDWSRYQIKRTSDKAKAIIAIISSKPGIECQKELLGVELQEYADKAKALGVTDRLAQAECCNFHHHGGYGAMKRVIEKTKKPYTLDNLYNAVLTDNVPNQIGTYVQRQKACYNMLKKYFPTSSSKTNTSSTSKNEPAKNTNNSTSSKPASSTTTSSSSSGNLNTKTKWKGYIKSTTTPRTWAGTENSALKSVGNLSTNTVVGVCDTVKDSKNTEWYYVVINNKIYGFVPASSVSKTKVEKTTNKTSNSTSLSTKIKWYGRVTADVLNVRVWAGTEFNNLKSVPTIKYGVKVGVCDTVKDSKNANWYYIVINGNTYGFVHSDYIKKV